MREGGRRRGKEGEGGGRGEEYLGSMTVVSL